MKNATMIVIALLTILLLNGCAPINRFVAGDDYYTEESFQGGSIVYHMEPGAIEHMRKMEVLLTKLRSYKNNGEEDKKTNRENVNRLYRDADTKKRNYIITEPEAKSFAKRMRERYEKELGETPYK